MRRRAVLAGVAALAAGAGCQRVFGKDAVRVRVMRASAGRVDGADAHCVLSESFVASHGVLERVLSSAETAPTGEWVTTGTDRATGKHLVADLRTHCAEVGGVYHWQGEAFVVSVRATGDATIEGSEAIRRGGPHDQP